MFAKHLLYTDFVYIFELSSGFISNAQIISVASKLQKLGPIQKLFSSTTDVASYSDQETLLKHFKSES